LVKKLYPLLSGGVDSTIAMLKRIQQNDFSDFQPVFFDYGQKARKEEWTAVSRVSKEIQRLDLIPEKVCFHEPKFVELSSSQHGGANSIFAWSRSELIDQKAVNNPYLENRNMILLSIIASYVESQISENDEAVIITGFRNEFPDTKAEFVFQLNSLLAFLLKETKKKISIEAPIIDYGPGGKRKMILDFKAYENIINLTWSCYRPIDGKPCNKCDACRDRKQAFCGVITPPRQQ
jgi:7-cyano-7-deazaguanine synthase